MEHSSFRALLLFFLPTIRSTCWYMFLTCSSNRSITALRAAASLRMGQISLQDSDTTVCSIYSLADTGLLRLMLLFGGLKVRYNCWSFSEGSHPLIDKQCNMSTGGTPWNHAEGFSPVSPFISCYKSNTDISANSYDQLILGVAVAQQE